MQTDATALFTIAGMALVTYLTRAGGLFLMERVTFSPRFKTWLNCLPGTVIISMVAPSVFSGNIAEAGAALATILVTIRFKSIFPAMLAGVGTVWLLRAVF
jgi:uncharacterized membrane protein